MARITVDDVCELITKKLGGRLSPDVTLDESSVLDDLGLSSLQTADIIYSLEDRLDTQFDPAEAADVKTVGQLVALANSAACDEPGAAPATTEPAVSAAETGFAR